MMKAGNSRQYPSARFVVLNDAESIAKARKNYFMWIIIVSLLFCITAAYLYHRTFLANPHFSNLNSESTANDTTIAPERSKYSPLKLYNPKPLLGGFRKRTSKSHWESTCEESQLQSEAIPAIFIQKIFEKNFQNIHDFVNFDLVLHYEYIISKYRATNLKEIFNEYHTKLSLVRNPGDFINFLAVLKSNKFNFYAGYLKVENLELKNFESVFSLTEELNYWYNYLVRLHVFLSSYERQKFRNYFVNVTAENFGKFTEDTHQQLFRFAYPFHVTDKKLQEINEIINEWAEPVKIVFDNSSVVFYGKVLLLSAINRDLSGLNVTNLKSSYFFASHVIFLDEDVELLGVDLTMIAPKWVFLRKIKINLSGLHGRNISDDPDSDQPGKPGNPGGNAGDFLGIGNPYEKFLHVIADGGNGGNGQNGARGQDGVSNTLPDPSVNKPACTSKVNSFRNTFGEVITHYKIYSSSGCGGSGTDGGAAGEGGMGGVITLINDTSVRIKKGSNGTPGLQGKGGAGGVGGRDGCFYEALDVDDEILHRVTRVKCETGNVLPSGEFGKDNHNTRGQIFPPAKENLKVHKCLLQFILYLDGDFNPGVISLLKRLNSLHVGNAEDTEDFVLEYKSLERLDKIEIYDLFNEKIDRYIRTVSSQPVLTYLKSIVLGQMIILKENINYLFIDLKNYMNILKRDIKTTNENTRDLHSVTYLKRKIEIKSELVKHNLKRIGLRLIAAARGSQSNFYTNCIMLRTIDVLQFLLNQTTEVKRLELIDLFMSCSMKFNVEYENNGKVLTEGKLTKEKRNSFEILENLTSKRDVRGHLIKLKGALWGARLSDLLSDEEKKLLEALNEELERVMALYYFVEWEELENLFVKSLGDLNLNVSSDSVSDKVVDYLKTRLVNVMVGMQNRMAMDATRQNLQPSNNINNHLQLFKNGSLIQDALTRLEDNVNGGTASFCKNHLKAVFDEKSAVGEFYFWPNSEIRNELRTLFSGSEVDFKSDLINRHVFDKNNVQFTTLRFIFECSRSCQKELNGILTDFKIQMTHSGYSYYNWKGDSYIVVSDKVTLEYSFRMRDNKEPEIYNALYKKCQVIRHYIRQLNFFTVLNLPAQFLTQAVLIFLGHRAKSPSPTLNLVAPSPEKPKLDSKIQNHEEHKGVRQALLIFILFKDGEIKLSPFTSWTLRLVPINEEADFNKLSYFADNANVRLTGIGTYAS